MCCMGSCLLALDGWNRQVLAVTNIDSNTARWGNVLLEKNNIVRSKDDIVTAIAWHHTERKLLVLLQGEGRTEIIIYSVK